MSDPGVALQGAIVSALKAAPAVAAFVGSRVYDEVPEEPTFPYVVVGDDDIGDFSDECHALDEVFCTVHCWSRAVGRVEAKQINAAVRAVLMSPLSVPGFSLQDQEFRISHVLKDPDGLSKHGVVTVRYVTEPV